MMVINDTHTRNVPIDAFGFKLINARQLQETTFIIVKSVEFLNMFQP